MLHNEIQMIPKEAVGIKGPVVDGLLKALLPGDTTNGVPGAIEINILNELNKDSNWNHQVQMVVTKVIEVVLNGEFINEQRLDQALEEYSRSKPRKWFAMVNPIMGILLTSYYSDERVRPALGINTVAPSPNGSKIHDTDMEILSSVYERGRIYRFPLSSSESNDR